MGSVSLFTFIFFSVSPQSFPAFLYMTMSPVFSSLFSLWQWNTVTPISRVPRHQNTAVWLSHFPAVKQAVCQHILHSFLPTKLLHLPLIFSTLSFYPFLFCHSLYRGMAATKIRAKQKVNVPVNICYESLLARSDAPFYIWFLCQHQGSATVSCKSLTYYETAENTFVELKIHTICWRRNAVMLQTVDITCLR